jgi:predicted NAD/FAD-binding protein
LKLAVIGSGIAGNAVAYALSTGSSHEISVFEQDHRPGGHSATITVDYDGVSIPVDTGFIVYNENNYPEFTALLDHLKVATHGSDMSFALSVDAGRFEWCGRDRNPVSGLFAQPKNLFSPSYLKMLIEILRFNKLASAELESGTLEDITLGAYLMSKGFSARFRSDYLLPMGAAIWSMSTKSMLNFPVRSFIAFFNNHHLLRYNGHQWRTVTGGSRVYVEKMVDAFRSNLRLSTRVRSIMRSQSHATLTFEDGHSEIFDGVILASHTDQSLALLADATPLERTILGAIAYQPNHVYLHRDPSLMPKRKRAWASWNVIQGKDREADLCVSYWMNQLQGIDPARPVFVTLNPPEPPAAALTFGHFVYDHPQFDKAAIEAQSKLDLIQGRHRTWFCGAWTKHGFHEDGLRSGLEVASCFGAVPEWRPMPALAEAAE